MKIIFNSRDYIITLKLPKTSEIFIKPILNEIDEAIATLLPEQKAEYRKIYNQVEGREVLIPEGFERDSDFHYRLRSI